MYAFLEYCQTSGKKLCNTVQFQVGTEVNAKYDENGATRVIFENDGTDDEIFQIELSTEAGQSLTVVTRAIELLGATAVSAILSSLFF